MSLISLESFLSSITASAATKATPFAPASPAAMLYYSVDPQFGALLFSLHARSERCSVFGDPFATCSFPPTPGTDLVGYAHSTLVQLLELGQHYACFLSQVRAGSVVLLVGVGSLVCWRLWAHWRYGVDEGEEGGAEPKPQQSPTSSPIKAASRGSRRTGLLASLLEEELFQESEDMDEDDPALIQQLLGLLKESVRDVMLGRYFGPDSSGFQANRRRLREGLHSKPGTLLTKACPQHGPKCGSSCSHQKAVGQHRALRNQLLGTPPSGSELGTSRSASTTSTPTEQRYLADHSASASSRDRDPGSSSSGGENGLAEERAAARCRRRKKRQHRASLRLSGSSGAGTEDRMVSDHRVITQRDGRLSSSREREPSGVRFYANAGTDEEYSSDANRDESEGVWAGASYSDLMERMRVRQVRRSLSREPSICSNLSDILMSPCSSQRRFPFRRDDSVCSNLSDFTMSECSELSMDVSVKEEVNNTFRCLEEIEQDLDEMKSSLLQMDEEVAMFVTKPDPYSLKMTFSDYSLSSKEENDSLPYLHDESHPSSVSEALAVVATALTGVQLKEALHAASSTGSDELPAVPEGQDTGTRASDTDAESSLEWDSPQHGWSALLTPGAGTGSDQKEEGLVSLEWDDGAVKQHPEPRPLKREDSLHTFHDNTAVSSQLLPDHSSMELDLEEELAGPSSLSPNNSSELPSSQPLAALDTDTFSKPSFNKSNPLMTDSTDSAIVTSMTTSGMTSSTISNNDLTGSFTIAANMTGSTDSAIYSAPGSRSATASPLPPMFSQSTLSSSGIGSIASLSGGCCGDASPDGVADGGTGADWPAEEADCEGGKVRRGVERAASLGGAGDRARQGEVGRRIGAARWSSDESGFAEPDSDGPTGCLSPVRELREKESSESSNSSSPRHMSSSMTNLRNTSTRRSNEGLNLIVVDNSTIDNINGNGIRNQTEVSFNNTINRNLNESHNRQNSNHFESTPTLQNQNQSDKTSVGNNSFSPEDLDDSLNGNGVSASATAGFNSNTTTQEGRRERSLSPASRHVMTIGEKVDLLEYSEREWRGDTEKAKIIRQGYSVISREVGLSRVRCIRGDQYCGVRAAVFQVLSSGHPLPRGAPALARLVAELASGATWIMSWTFGNRLHYGNVLDGIRDCLETLDNVGDNLVGCCDRDTTLEKLLNTNPRLDLQLCEAVKLHMLASALQLHGTSSCGNTVPLFAMIMFARQSSQTPADFMKNHLNIVGDTGGLEQIEMFLLGHSLKATLQVVRPASYGAEDFVCYYPDTNIGVWPQLPLIAEDDRHYNVIVE